jgi:hypothetical protein
MIGVKNLIVTGACLKSHEYDSNSNYLFNKLNTSFYRNLAKNLGTYLQRVFESPHYEDESIQSILNLVLKIQSLLPKTEAVLFSELVIDNIKGAFSKEIEFKKNESYSNTIKNYLHKE